MHVDSGAGPSSRTPYSRTVATDEKATGPGDGLVRAGVGVFGVGLVAVLVVVLPFFFGHENRPLVLNLAAGVLPPLGLLLALAGLVRGARRTQR